MVKTILALDLEVQQISWLNEHIMGANQIWKANQSTFMSKLVKHSWDSKQSRETTTISNSSPVNEQMKGERTMWNVFNNIIRLHPTTKAAFCCETNS